MENNFRVQLMATGFGHAIYDTNDLSVIRGGSRALLNAPRLVFDNFRSKLNADSVIASLLICDASQALIDITGFDGEQAELDRLLEVCHTAHVPGSNHWAPNYASGGPEDAEELLELILPDLTILSAATPATDCLSNDWRTLRNMLAVKRLQTFTMVAPSRQLEFSDSPEFNRAMPCKLDNLRPRNAIYFLPTDTDEQSGLTPMSSFTALRRKLGRGSRRKEYYLDQFGIDVDVYAQTNVSFADSFEEIIENPPTHVSDIVGSKMCVLYFDGNAFGRLFENLAIQGIEELSRGSQMISRKRNELLDRLIRKWICDDNFLSHDPLRKKQDGKSRSLPVFRFETLLWGGDEAIIVFPAWCLETVLVDLSENLAENHWKMDESTLTHALGLLVCSHKFPIRDARKLAAELADLCKAAPGGRDKNQLQYINLQGTLDLPTRGLEDERQALLGIEKDRQAEFFSIEMNIIAEVLAGMKKLRGVSGEKTVGVPRAKLMRLHDQLSEAGRLGECRSVIEQEISDFANDLLEKRGYLAPGIDGSLSPIDQFDFMESTNYSADAPAAFLHHTLKLWSLLAGGENVADEPMDETTKHEAT
ncbi:MAG: hypothetical protein GY761_06800 [Hyphomicrobiales bacterium]|nr:hypothetical protein [Hyphomicrobiales bacterium]